MDDVWFQTYACHKNICICLLGAFEGWKWSLQVTEPQHVPSLGYGCSHPPCCCTCTCIGSTTPQVVHLNVLGLSEWLFQNAQLTFSLFSVVPLFQFYFWSLTFPAHSIAPNCLALCFAISSACVCVCIVRPHSLSLVSCSVQLLWMYLLCFSAISCVPLLLMLFDSLWFLDYFASSVGLSFFGLVLLDRSASCYLFSKRVSFPWLLPRLATGRSPSPRCTSWQLRPLHYSLHYHCRNTSWIWTQRLLIKLRQPNKGSLDKSWS